MLMRPPKRVNFPFAAAILFLLCFGGFAAKQACAAIYYVSPTGSDGSSGSASAPFGSIQRAANVVGPGDTVIVKNGTYTGGSIVVNITSGGTASNWVTFKAENQWGAIIDGRNNSSDYCVNLTSGADYVRIEGFQIKGCAYGGIWSNESAHDVYIFNNEIHDIARGIIVPYDPMGSIGRSGVFQGTRTSKHIYDSNIFYGIGRAPHPDLKSSQCNKPVANWCYWQDFGHDHGIYIRGRDSRIINNVFYDLRAGYGIQVAPEVRGLDIVNNTFVGPNPRDGGGGIMLWNRSNCHVKIQNNIFADYRRWAISFCNYAPSGVETYNNLTSPGTVLLEPTCSSKGITEHNDIQGRDPEFVDVARKNFHLQAGSPAIDRGYKMGAPHHDRDRNIRPGGSGIDIGAYEYLPTGK